MHVICPPKQSPPASKKPARVAQKQFTSSSIPKKITVAAISLEKSPYTQKKPKPTPPPLALKNNFLEKQRCTLPIKTRSRMGTRNIGSVRSVIGGGKTKPLFGWFLV